MHIISKIEFLSFTIYWFDFIVLAQRRQKQTIYFICNISFERNC